MKEKKKGSYSKGTEMQDKLDSVGLTKLVMFERVFEKRDLVSVISRDAYKKLELDDDNFGIKNYIYTLVDEWLKLGNGLLTGKIEEFIIQMSSTEFYKGASQDTKDLIEGTLRNETEKVVGVINKAIKVKLGE